MITTVLFKSSKISLNLPTEQIPSVLGENDTTIWTDIKNPNAEEMKILEEIFHFHPLAIEYCIKPATAPKVAHFENFIFLTFYSVKPDKHNKKLIISPLIIFLGKNHIVSFHRHDIECVQETFEIIKHNPGETIAKGADFTLYIMLDIMAEKYLRHLDVMHETINKLEERITTKETPDLTHEIHQLKKDMLFLRRISAPQRDGIAKLTRENDPFIKQGIKIYLLDVYDKFFKICEIVSTYLDILIGTHDLLFSVISNRTNQIMKVLTMIATILMPLTLITGIYGMNFRYMPELAWKYGYFAVLTVMLIIAAILITVFKRKKWF